MKALVIGNGESRSSINLKNIPKDISTIGCNGIHRDMQVDHLVCCDRRMVEEAVVSENTKLTKIYARPDWFKYYRKIQKDKRIHQVPDLQYQGNKKQDHPTHWGSGPYAILLSTTIADDITLLGFDLYSHTNTVNNIYKDTKNYAKRSAKPVDYSYWLYQIARVFEYNKNKKFTIVNANDWEFPKQWQFKNVQFAILDSKNLTYA